MAGIIIGLTGPTGSGKTTVRLLMESWKGIVSVDADAVARQVVDKGHDCLVELAMEFSPVIINIDGTLNRKKLASMVFNDAEKLKKLNSITLPYIMEEIKMQIASALAAKARGVILDAPLLFESGADKFCDKIVAVVAPEQVRLKRILRRDELTAEEALARINSQRPESFYTGKADFVLYNSGDMVELRLGIIELQNYLGL